MPSRKMILFTAFEPSGDSLAAPLIARLQQLAPDTDTWALGGPLMRAAGARLIEDTTHAPVMLIGAAGKIISHHRQIKQLKTWLIRHQPAAVVPVDSPAANWSICRAVRRHLPRTKIIHLVAPQLWAWAPWRIAKLRRLTDHVLCVLPFEPAWFGQRGVRATFVGHPLFDPPPSPINPPARLPAEHEPPPDNPTLAILPGSRPGEVRANLPTMLRAFEQLRNRHPDLRGIVAVRDEPTCALAQQVADQTFGSGTWPQALDLRTGQTNAALAQADLAIVVSGTATLQVAAHRKPMVVLYNVGWWSWQLLGRWLVTTRTFALPNLLTAAQDNHPAVPEFVPHFGQVGVVADAVHRLINHPAARTQQQQAFDHIHHLYAQRAFADTAAHRLLEALDRPSQPPSV